MLKVLKHHLITGFKQYPSILCVTCGITQRKCHAVSKKDELPWQRDHYKHFLAIQTRWSDNDQYGHVNNVIYYSYFDTIINHYLIKCCGLNTDLKTSNIVGYMVDTKCIYRTPISFPEVVLAGLYISHIGRSSVHYTVAIFPELSEQASDDHPHLSKCGISSQTDQVILTKHSSTACAVGQCVHVFVDTDSNKPVPLPDNFRAALEKIAVVKDTTRSKL
ncbi:uncharacterized protein LOC110981055 isoform X2 [Acanthaster planci]|nr:uncharacterized protein LOC110981055 isoform X2 [Acanthaster planci]